MPNPFFTRPNWEDRQVVQYTGTSITLSGDTNINPTGNFRIYKDAFPGLVATSLDSDGTVGWGPISGISWSISACTSPLYVNNLVSCPSSGGTIQVDAGNLALNSELNFLIPLSAGTTTDNVLVIDGSGYIKSVPQSSITSIFTGGTGTCITDLYVTNIHSCSPLNINPLDEGNIYFGSTSGLTYDVTNKRLGLGINSPSYLLHISGKTSNTEVYYNDSNPSPSFLLKTNNNNNLSFIGVQDGPSNSSVILTFRGLNEPSNSAFGKPGDATLYASVNTNGLNIMNNNGTSKEDYIRFYAGTNASGDSPDMHIQGSGATTGYIGMGTKIPTAKLHIYTTNGYDQFKMETLFTPTSSGDTNGSIGSIVWDDTYFYVKTNTGWGRTLLDYAF